jgi:O-antigen/teichoic acid export membrane protein
MFNLNMNLPLQSHKYIKLISKNYFVRNVALVASGTAAAQVISIIFAPFMTRLYGPQAYGLQGTFIALVGMIGPVAALSYPIAIVLPKNNADAQNLVKLSVIISIAIAIIAVVAFTIAGNDILKIIGADEIASLGILVPIVLLFSAWLQIVQQWLIRYKAFKVTARVAVVQSLVTNLAKTVGGLIYPTANMLILLQTIGIALYAFLLGNAAQKNSYKNESDDKKQQYENLKVLAYQYRDFPLYRTPQIFINSASQSLPVLMLASLFGPAAAGFYALARTVIGMPATLIAESVGTVFYPQIAEAHSQGKSCFKPVATATMALAAVGLIPFGLIMLFGPWLFQLVFGTQWALAGVYARWLAFMYYFNFINRPTVSAIPVLGLQKGLLIYEIFSTGTKILALYFGLIIYKSDEMAVSLFAIVGAIAYLMLIIWVMYVAHNTKMEFQHA